MQSEQDIFWTCALAQNRRKCTIQPLCVFVICECPWSGLWNFLNWWQFVCLFFLISRAITLVILMLRLGLSFSNAPSNHRDIVQCFIIPGKLVLFIIASLYNVLVICQHALKCNIWQFLLKIVSYLVTMFSFTANVSPGVARKKLMYYQAVGLSANLVVEPFLLW